MRKVRSAPRPGGRRVRDALDDARVGGQAEFGHRGPLVSARLGRNRFDVARSGCSGAPGGSRSAPARVPPPTPACASASSRRRAAGKSSRACAPRLSVRLAAEWIVAVACSSRFSSSSVSIRSVFQMSERSRDAHVREGGERRGDACSMPSARLSPVRNTAASSCMVFCISRRIAAVGRDAVRVAQPVEARDRTLPGIRGQRPCGALPGLTISAQRRAASRPKTTRSSSELVPRRLAPCTETHAASPTAIRPGHDAIRIAVAAADTTSPW